MRKIVLNVPEEVIWMATSIVIQKGKGTTCLVLGMGELKDEYVLTYKGELGKNIEDANWTPVEKSENDED